MTNVTVTLTVTKGVTVVLMLDRLNFAKLNIVHKIRVEVLLGL
jgi:hypothetical protein